MFWVIYSTRRTAHRGREAFRGTLTQTSVSPREIVKRACTTTRPRRFRAQSSLRVAQPSLQMKPNQALKQCWQ